MAMKKRYLVAAAMLLVAAYEIVTMPGPTKFQPYLPGVTDARSWLETNCRGPGRDGDKCKATIAALEGSGADALKLAAGIASDDLSGRHYWLHIAAQNGNPEAMRLLAQALAELPDEKYGRVHRIRARFWLENAVRAGDREAANLLPQMQTVSKEEAAAHRIKHPANSNPTLICGPMPWWRYFALLWGDHDIRLSTNQGANLPCAAVSEFEINALRGETNWRVSAGRLASFILLIQYIPSNHHFYWETIAAENGDPRDAGNLGSYSVRNPEGGAEMKIRGRYWLRKAVAALDAGDYNDLFREELEKVKDQDLATEWLSERP